MRLFKVRPGSRAHLRGAGEAYPVQLDGVDPPLSALWVLRSEVPHAVVHAYVQSALVELVGLRERSERTVKGMESNGGGGCLPTVNLSSV